jgi:hypothetical protein
MEKRRRFWYMLRDTIFFLPMGRLVRWQRRSWREKGIEYRRRRGREGSRMGWR